MPTGATFWHLQPLREEEQRMYKLSIAALLLGAAAQLGATEIYSPIPAAQPLAAVLTKPGNPADAKASGSHSSISSPKVFEMSATRDAAGNITVGCAERPVVRASTPIKTLVPGVQQ